MFRIPVKAFTTVNAVAVQYLAIIIVAELEQAVQYLESWEEPLDTVRALARLAGVKHLVAQANFGLPTMPTSGNVPLPEVIADLKRIIDRVKTFVVRTGQDENLLNDGTYVFRTFAELHDDMSRLLTHPGLKKSTIIGQTDDDRDYATPPDQAS